jgi:hypothetical protein
MLLCTASCAISCAAPRAPAPASAELDTTVALSDWGLAGGGALHHARVGLHHGRPPWLQVYELNPVAPPVAPATPAGRSAPPPLREGLFVISRFEYGPTNALGGHFGVFARSPSRGALGLRDLGGGPRALSFVYRRAGRGHAGLWIHLFAADRPPAERVYVDARGTAYLGFAVRGTRGDERLELRIADRRRQERGDAVSLGDVGAFTAAGRLRRRWQQAWIPLDHLPAGLSRDELAAVVLVATAPGRGRIELKDLLFSRDRSLTAPPVATGWRRSRRDRPLRSALWLWQSDAVRDGDGRTTLLDFCRRQGITDLFLQLPDTPLHHLAGLLTALHAQGVRVHALDGEPRNALPDRHEHQLARLRAVLAHNAGAPAAQRFDGIHLDIEPHLLPGFASARKPALLRSYLALLQRARALTRPAGLPLGVAIPFWLDARNRFFAPLAELDGRPLSEHVLAAVDSVVIMDYRTGSHGFDGIVAHAWSELGHAAALGREVFLGLETSPVADETIHEFTSGAAGLPLLAVHPAGPGRLRLTLHPRGLPGPLPAGSRLLGSVHRERASGDRISFARLSPRDLLRVRAEVSAELADIPSFAGFAIHSYESYRPWLERHRRPARGE